MFSLLVRMAWEEHMEKKRHTTASGEDYLEAILVLQWAWYAPWMLPGTWRCQSPA